MVPELSNEGARASKEADMYAFGMLVYEVITGAQLFEHHWAFALPTLDVRGSRPPRPEDPVSIGFSQGTWDFVERCWNENPELRPSATEALDHFRRAARTSTDVGPGPTVPIREPHPKWESLCECNGPAVFLPDNAAVKLLFHSSTGSTSRFQQASYATRALVSNRAVPVDPLLAIREPN